MKYNFSTTKANMMIHSSSRTVPFRRLACLALFFSSLSICSLRCAANNGLEKLWDIQGPEGKICRSERDNDVPSSEGEIETATCDNSSSIIRLDYTIHKNAKYPMYRIYRKDCQEEFEAGTEIVFGSISPDEDKRMNLSTSASPDDNDHVTASLEILLAEGSLTKSWWERLTFYVYQEKTVDFCVRTGLWLPPQAGKTEVNFRETNIAVTFGKEEGAEQDDYTVKSVSVNPKDLVGIEVNLFGALDQKKKSYNEPEDQAQASTATKEEL